MSEPTSLDQSVTDSVASDSTDAPNYQDLEHLNAYLCSICYPLLDVDKDYFYKAVHETQHQKVIYQFVTEARTLIVSKSSNKEQKLISLHLEMVPGDLRAHSVAFIKRSTIMLADKTLDSPSAYASLLQVINIGYSEVDFSPYKLTHNYVQNCFVPLFGTVKTVEDLAKKTSSDKQNFQNLLKKLSEVSLALVRCQQNLEEVREIRLYLDPEVKAVCKRAKEENRAPKLEDFGPLLEDPNFVDTIARTVQKWIEDVSTETKRNYDLTGGTTLQEINYWLSLERSLNFIEQQMKLPEVDMSLQILRAKRRFNVVYAFENDLQFNKVSKSYDKVAEFMREFPINDLLSATTTNDLIVALQNVFTHMKRIGTIEGYDTTRCFQLIETVARDLKVQMLKILSDTQIMMCSFEELNSIIESANTVFTKFNEQYNILKNYLKNSRNEAKKGFPCNFDFLPLQDRLMAVFQLRREHEQLREVIENILQSSDVKRADLSFLSIKEIDKAYSIFLTLDVLDISPEGEENWKAAKKVYDPKIDRVEAHITSKLRDKLGSASNAKEMFRIFAKFNALFFRPHIKGAIHEYQSQLLKTVQKDIQALREKFLTFYPTTDAALISKIRDIPGYSGKIIWTKQISRKLKQYMERVETILGKNWYEHPEGKALKEIGDNFEKHLNVNTIAEAHIKEMQNLSNDLHYQDKIFAVNTVRRSDKLQLVVNFDERIISLFKEVRNFKWLSLRVPFTLQFKANEVQQIYPNALSLQDSLRTFNMITSKIDDRLGKLVAQHKKDVLNTIQTGAGLTWSFRLQLPKYVKLLADKVNALEDVVNNLNEKIDKIYSIMTTLNTCSLDSIALNEKLKTIQSIVDDFNLLDVSNLHLWVPELDAKIEAILSKRLTEHIAVWIKAFENFKKEGNEFIKTPVVHEIKIQDQVIYVDPPIEYARYYWLQEFHKQLGIICSLPRIEASRYNYLHAVNPQEIGQKKEYSYEDLVAKLPPEVIVNAYNKIETTISAAEKYVRTWLSYQSLWEIDIKKVYHTLGDDIDKWHKLLNEIKQGRQTFDNSETERDFGAVVVDYRFVQVKINNKYDAWHKEILNQFGVTFNENLKSFHSAISAARRKLEKVNFTGSSSSEVTEFITETQEIRRQYNVWQNDIEKFRSGQKLLDRQRYHVPSDWLYIEQVEGEWSNFKQIMTRKVSQMEAELPAIQAQIVSDEQLQNEKLREIEEMWRTQRPYSGEILPNIALDTLNIIEQSLTRVKDNFVRICKAKELLDMEPGNMQRVDVLDEEIQGLKGVWTELNKVWSLVDALKETPLSAAVPKKIKQTFDDANQMMNDFPPRLRQYEAFETMKNRLGNYKKMSGLVIELKNDAMKPHHWRKLLEKLKIKTSLTELQIGHLWAADILRYENSIKDILTVARGELVLEEMLRAIKEFWSTFELELVRYQNKCKLIRGWDEFFAKIDEDINNLSSMKMSPYYKSFEAEILQWDDKLQKMRIIFDIWIDVQRRWVYLEGIFFGSSDIKEQLSNEFTRFKGIDNEFVTLMKKTAQKPLVVDVVSTPGLQKTLERLADLLAKIQKALGDYLETQRSQFARFYFVGDSDLLEIIGNSKDVTNVQRHFSKMFAGITSLNNEDNGDLVVGMNSREGESVAFHKSVRISEDPSIHVWLTKIEDQMRLSLATNLENCVKQTLAMTEGDDGSKNDKLLQEISDYPAQVVLLGMQVIWSTKVEKALESGAAENLPQVINYILSILGLLAEKVLTDLRKDIRQKYEQLITDFVHQRDVTRLLLKQGAQSPKDFSWQYHMRFYWSPKEADPLKKLLIQMAIANFHYGFEYLGVGEKLVQTPLTDKCYLTLTLALHLRMGGAPFGPAGTGKTESVKALGSQLGRFVLVFNCDETFDFHAMGRIFVGLCQVGAWGCFDEFNRLEERMLSAVSQQILTIQAGLREQSSKIELLGKEVKLNAQMGVFVTMNPGYAGRSNLPENLKQLFRQMAMVKPDRELIAQVMLYSQGYRSAERLAGKIVSLFELCNDQLSSQPHYDFGLRALKSVLVSAGNLKRSEKNSEIKSEEELVEWEQNILLRSVCDTIVPKLISEDIPLLSTLLSGVFPGAEINPIKEEKLREAIQYMCKKRHLLCTDSFMEKTLQLYQIQKLAHGVMMVGPSGCGKSAAWRVLMEAMYRVDRVKGEFYIVDPKAVSKDDLYGKLDSTTLEWTDGIFTHILRKITENVRGESSKRHWIIFDGDVDPEWAENLNSVLDDNKLLTLPNGERINIPPNVRIMFEVETLKYATLATVSRCGMVWFSDDVVHLDMVFHHYLNRLRQEEYDEQWKGMFEGENEDSNATANKLAGNNAQKDEEAAVRDKCVDAIKGLYAGEGSVGYQAIVIAENLKHVMDFTKIRVLEATFALVRKGIANILEYNESHPDFPLEDQAIEKYMKKWTVLAICWGVGGSMGLHLRGEFSNKLRDVVSDVELPPFTPGTSFLEFGVNIEDQEWYPWKRKVPTVDIDPQRVTDADLIITTVDTLRHQEVLCSWLSEHRPFLLCGPPGSGKTMTLMSTLKALPDFEMVFVNFSSSTSPTLLLKTFDQYCEYTKTTSGVTLRPKQPNKWLVVFCDEINLPDTDKYGTQAVITFLRQLTEQKGFWRNADKVWVSLERIQFVGACNPPTDVGRHPLSNRFLRHTPLILVDFPGPESLKQIYGTFNRAMLRRVPQLRQYGDALTDAMVEFYMKSQQRFTSDMQPHYIYSPRELTRWKYAINEALEPLESVEDLVRLWAHEALRLFQDRLVYPEEKEWCEKQVDETAFRYFPNINEKALERPILFTTYLSKNYVSVDREVLRSFVSARLKVFYEEELNVPIVVFDSVLDHILRIDRVLRQPLGHCLLVGASGVGKTTLSRFVSWMNNLNVFQIKAGRNYSLADFDNDLREVMTRAGCKGEKICFIFDESNVLSVAFMERMNALLASGEVPGLFEGEEYLALINQCKEATLRDNKMMDSEEQLYKNFVRSVQRNLHVVFTMNPSNPDFSNRGASSPALFNRCVIDWFGEWSNEGLWQVAKEFTLTIDPAEASFTKQMYKDSIEARHEMIVHTIVYTHNTVKDINTKLSKSAKKFNYITPRDFLDFIKHFVRLHAEKKEQLEEQQYHLNVGLGKLKETEEQVVQLQKSLDTYKTELESKEKEANEKLKLMVKEQKEAETKKENSIILSKELEIKQAEIKEQQTIVSKQLDEAIPALEKAKNSVNNVKKNELDLMRNFANPPALVKLTSEAVISLLIKKFKKPFDWSEIRAELRKTDFISKVLNFDTNSVPVSLRNQLMENYINKPEWDVEKIRGAAQAAGPLAEWVESQLKYAGILENVQPLRDKVEKLQVTEKQLLIQNDELNSLITELQKKIEQYQAEYAELITEVQNIKSEMQKVQDKVARSQNLITNLSSERYRWENSSKNFKQQLANMTGDVMLSAAFLAYIGFFDHYYRKVLMNCWRDYLETQGLLFRQDLSIVEFLSKPSERLQWQAHQLPADDLCTENAIILSKFNRYPLIIDPAGQALEFLVSFYKDKKIARTSFADDAFMKNLETALRFGCPLLVQDVEKIDPIMNSVLNKEIHKTGGRILIRVGDQEIDFAPTFTMFMITRDSNARFTPDLCSRVTFVNFTVTPSSLQNQCLNIYLKHERADIDEKRTRLLKLQGEYIVKLRELEDSLLNALYNVTGNILDNTQVITTLETLKAEAAVVTKEMEESNRVMEEVQTVTRTYEPLAEASSKIFFAMGSLGQVYFLYQFSLSFFMEIVYNLLNKNEKLGAISKTDYDARLRFISKELFTNVYHRISHALMIKDKMLFAMRLAQIKLGNDKPLSTDLFNILIKGISIIETKLSGALLDGKLSLNQLKMLEEISDTPYFQDLVAHMDSNTGSWLNFLSKANAEEGLPTGWENTEHEKTIAKGNEDLEIARIIKDMILIKIFRPDKFNLVCNKFVRKVLGDEFLDVPQLDLSHVVQKESNAKSPLLLCSAPGFDASFKVDQLVKELGKKYVSVAIGSAEGFDQAEKAINQAAKAGTWVLLKNVHLAPSWLQEVEKKIHRLQIHDSFRLFLTMEFNEKVPGTLIRQSLKFVFEPPDGIKASLQRTYGSVLTAQRSDKKPVERSRLHFLLAWLHAVIQERLRYTPIGWTKVYEFNEADQRCSLDLIDELINSFGDRNNLPPEKIPWDAIKCILTQNLYGGKVDNEYDSKILVSLVNQFFSPACFESGFQLFSSANEKPLTIPEALKTSQYVEWVDNLPVEESPAWSGLPVNVEKILKEQQANYVLAKLWQVQDANEEEIKLESVKETSTQQKKGKTDQVPQVQWLRDLDVRVTKYLAILPATLEKLNRTAGSITNPLFRFLEREVTVASNLLNRVRGNLIEIKNFCEGKIQSTADMRKLAKELHSDEVPVSWKRYIVAKLSVTDWITDFKKRLDQFNHIIPIKEYQKKGVWMGGLLYPEAYLTATRQFVAQNNKWSLEELDLQVEIYEDGEVDEDSFLITGMIITGANWSKSTKTLEMTEELSFHLPTLKFRWVKVQRQDKGVEQEGEILTPVYLNKSRANLLFSVKLNRGSISKTVLYQKGLALIACDN